MHVLGAIDLVVTTSAALQSGSGREVNEHRAAVDETDINRLFYTYCKQIDTFIWLTVLIRLCFYEQSGAYSDFAIPQSARRWQGQEDYPFSNI